MRVLDDFVARVLPKCKTKIEFQVGGSADKSNPGAHHARTEHADLARDIRRKTLRPRTSGVDLIEMKP
ncbi:MAG: hypothetical protein RR993_05495, partial [Clostridia bacterium]